MGAPIKVPVTRGQFLHAGRGRADPHPELSDAAPDEQPRQLHRQHGQCLPLDGRAGRGLGVEIFPGMSCSELVYDGDRVSRAWSRANSAATPTAPPAPTMSRGWSCTASMSSCPKACAAALSKQVIAKYDLSKGKSPQKFGLGMKEIWEIDPEKHREGTVTHTMGWPLGSNAGGGSSSITLKTIRSMSGSWCT
jgi:electron-transferring-flavoprotein dehydrogenase